MDAAGVAGATINTQGSTNIVVSAPGAPRDRLNALDQTAVLLFRQVLTVGPYTAANAAPQPSASAVVPQPIKGEANGLLLVRQ